MATDSIIEKLKRELQKDVIDECQVVFVLSRIRKYLETFDSKDAYASLNFYCDWALHTEIENTWSVREAIIGLKHLNVDGLEFVEFTHFGRVFNKFLQNNHLPTSWISTRLNWEKLKNILQDIYTDSPLYVKSSIKDSSNVHVVEKITLTKTATGIKWFIDPTFIAKPFKQHKP